MFNGLLFAHTHVTPTFLAGRGGEVLSREEMEGLEERRSPISEGATQKRAGFFWVPSITHRSVYHVKPIISEAVNE